MDFNKLWQNFLDTVTNHYFDLNGRVGIAQFWYFMLVELVVFIALGLVQIFLLPGLLTFLFSLAMLLPNLGMSTRRLQDTGKNGMFALVALGALGIYSFISLVGLLGGGVGALGFLLFFLTIGWVIGLVGLVAGAAVVYFCIQPGQADANSYGPPPPIWTPT